MYSVLTNDTILWPVRDDLVLWKWYTFFGYKWYSVLNDDDDDYSMLFIIDDTLFLSPEIDTVFWLISLRGAVINAVTLNRRPTAIMCESNLVFS